MDEILSGTHHCILGVT